MLLAHGPEIKFVAMVTGIAAANLFARTAQIMAEIDPQRTWTNEAEARLRFLLEEMGPKFTYRRPRYLTGRRAVHHLLAELEDYQMASRSQISRIWSLLGWFDPSLVLRLPSARPSEIVGLGVERNSYSDRWLGAIAEAFPRLKVWRDTGEMILAEKTVITKPVWEKYCETRLSQFVTRGESAELPINEHSFFLRSDAGYVE